MKLPIATAALFLAATTALPASAAAPTGLSFYEHQGRSVGLHRDQGPHRARAGAYYAYDAYAMAPSIARPAATNWGRCVDRYVGGDAYSAYPSWDMC